MGDRCWLSVSTRKQDLPVVTQECMGHRDPKELRSWTEEYEEVGRHVYFTVAEANYAWDTELRTAAAKGAVFIAENTAGGAYPCGFLVSDGKIVLQIDTADGAYAVATDARGRVSKEQLRKVAQFVRLRTKVKKLLDSAKKEKG